MKILITGGTGFIGGQLTKQLLAMGHQVTVLTRYPQKQSMQAGLRLVDSLSQLADNEIIDGIINLAGAPINKRWTPQYKNTLIDSRVNTTEQIAALVQRLLTRPRVFISGSAIGFYGHTTSADGAIVDETSQPTIDTQQNDFAHQLCARWEAAAATITELGVKTYIIRLGVVLDSSGGALAEMLPAFKLGLGGKIGSGRQGFSWIHRDDAVNAIHFLLADSASPGVYNLTAPYPVTNAAFSQALAKALHRPCVMTIPAFAIRLLFGEMGETLLLNGQCVKPTRLLSTGFAFQYPTLQEALSGIGKKP
ncbi:TIGR01777 family oxidoreductase [Ostreibacterium oceani]|uniref:TIGR01777 family protein n=1 Tax=Ostreibacterium oceani TaxID=2654998 RepID=A0A6N7EYW1_9GAMM|nr:TIGR01777 family oxidoreductase [Ostreibacterium oceani]MPV86347.1 TIGR01777 family protein [Ostreibacterium oceani]